MVVETSIRIGGTWENLDTVYIKIAGVWKRLDELHIKIATVWKQVHAGLSATDDGPADSAVDGTRSPEVGDTTVTPLDGAGSKTVAWVYVSGDADIVIDDAAAAATFWTVPSNPAGKDAVWQWTVTDGHSETVTGTVNVNFLSSA